MLKIFYLSIVLVFVDNITFCQENENYEVLAYNNISYFKKENVSIDSLQMLNLVVPVKSETFPLLIWIGGGAWSYVDRNVEMNLAKKFAEKGIAVASIGHRLSPAIWRDPKLNTGIQHPKHMEDVAASIKWLYDNPETYGYDRNNLFIGGYSSGGHLSALIALDSNYLNHVGLSPDIFRGIIPISGTFDIVDYHEVLLNGARPELAKLHVEAVFGNTKEGFLQSSPTHYLDHLKIPMLIICDNNLYQYTKLFEERIRETAFRDVQVIYDYHLTHGQLWRNLSFSEKSVYRNVMIDFIESHLEI